VLVPLLNQSPLSKIGSVFLSSTALSSGEWTKVDLLDQRVKKIKSVARGCGTGKPFVSIFGDGAKGPLVLTIASCYQALYDALKTLANSPLVYAAVLYHPRQTLSLDVEVMALSIVGDEQWISGDPVEGVRVVLESHGVTTP
jgi:hypothetical protein